MTYRELDSFYSENFGIGYLNSSQTTNEDLRTLIDNFLNGGVKTTQGTVMRV